MKLNWDEAKFSSMLSHCTHKTFFLIEKIPKFDNKKFTTPTYFILKNKGIPKPKKFHSMIAIQMKFIYFPIFSSISTPDAEFLLIWSWKIVAGHFQSFAVKTRNRVFSSSPIIRWRDLTLIPTFFSSLFSASCNLEPFQ
jgi:hypothetical protein